MGGYGSGFRGAAKATTEARPRVAVGRLAKAGALAPGTRAVWTQERRGEPWASLGTEALPGAMVLTYDLNGTPQRDVIALERAPCRFGGSRPWFLCPWCGRRRGFLYATLHGFCCRTCGDLQYPVTREEVDYRALRRADKLRARLGWEPGIAFGIGPKPKGMHWRTYARLLGEYDRLVDAIQAAELRWLEGFKNLLD